MKCECKLKEFVEKYPEYRRPFNDFLSDPLYIARFKLDKNGELECLEVGYKSDLWAIDKFD